MNRRTFLKRSALIGGAFMGLSPFHSLMARMARGEPPPATEGYGPLVFKGDLWLPREFNYQVISRQGVPMSDGRPTPGAFDGMGAFAGPATEFVRPDGITVRVPTTILIRNHENRERGGEQKVVVGPPYEYDPVMLGGNVKLVVRREKTGESDPLTGEPLYAYTVVEDFAILGGTSSNCAGGVLPFKKWITCEEVVKGPAGTSDPRSVTPGPPTRKHGYLFEVDALSEGPYPAVPILAAGRFVHEAATWRAGILYQTEDRIVPIPGTNPPVSSGIGPDPLTEKKLLGCCFYRYIPDHRVGQSGNLAETTGVLQALKLRDEFHANMDVGRVVGVPYDVEWVDIDEPDHDDDTDDRRDRVPGFTPVRVQAQDKGAAFFNRLEGMWAGTGDAKLYFDATEGGHEKLGQVWEYDPGRETLTLIYESTDAARLESPDNITVVPKTGDLFLCEDGSGDQFIRGLTQDGEIYDFAKTGPTNRAEFAGACFDPDGQTLYVNQYGARGSLPGGPPGRGGVTYAIYGPFERRAGANNKNFGNGPGL